MDARTDAAHLQVYSDGTAGPDEVAAAAMLRVFGQPPKTIGIRLRTQEDHSALGGEPAGIHLAAQLVRPHI
jgi:hypothetical protein